MVGVDSWIPIMCYKLYSKMQSFRHIKRRIGVVTYLYVCSEPDPGEWGGNDMLGGYQQDTDQVLTPKFVTCGHTSVICIENVYIVAVLFSCPRRGDVD